METIERYFSGEPENYSLITSIAENTLKKSIEHLKTDPTTSTNLTDVIKMLQEGLYNIRREQVLTHFSIDEFNRAIIDVAEQKSPWVGHYKHHSKKCFNCLKSRIASNWYSESIGELIEWIQRRYIQYINASFPDNDIKLLKKTIHAVSESSQKREELASHVLDHISNSNCSFKELCETCEVCLMYRAIDHYKQHPIARKIAEDWLNAQ